MLPPPDRSWARTETESPNSVAITRERDTASNRTGARRSSVMIPELPLLDRVQKGVTGPLHDPIYILEPVGAPVVRIRNIGSTGGIVHGGVKLPEQADMGVSRPVSGAVPAPRERSDRTKMSGAHGNYQIIPVHVFPREAPCSMAQFQTVGGSGTAHAGVCLLTHVPVVGPG